MPWEDKDVVCPYWHKFDNNKIVCEGLLPDSTMSTVFHGKGERRAHVRRYCTKSEYKGCKVCKAIESNYE